MGAEILSVTQHTWTHPSVLRLSLGHDPIANMQQLCREIALNAIDKGWEGPPFDPFKLCRLLGIMVIPNVDIPDARISVTDGRTVIEYNPDQPKTRIRFSIAHEIAHTVFPDWQDEIRNRQRQESESKDNWQLEMLCNLGAAELLVPFADIPELATILPSVNTFQHLQRIYDLSIEAIANYFIRTSSLKCLSILLSPASSQLSETPRYRIDYILKSSAWREALTKREYLPKTSYFNKFIAIGETAHSTEDWVSGGPLSLEAIGLNPLPGQVVPRLMIIAYDASDLHREPRIQYVTHDVTEPIGEGKKVIAFLVNDTATVWGGGVAKAVGKKFPGSIGDYRRWCFNSENKLGECHFFDATDQVTTCAMVAQHGWGRSNNPKIRYAALATCLDKLAAYAHRIEASVHVPRIGLGAAGGSWSIVEEMIIQRIIDKGIETLVYTYDPVPPQIRQERLL
jgi:O-acetyl-ADP-ribose deacetylase (regulator of RNase III)